MANSKPKRDRYDISGNLEAEYVDPEQTVLVNKLQATELSVLQLAEERGLARAYASLLGEVRIDTPLSAALIRQVHERIFGEMYTWAGKWRTVWISKPGVTWPSPDFLEQAMHQYEAHVLSRHHPAELLATDEFCAAAAEIQGEFLVIHPFREGNARTIKLVTDLLAMQTGRPMLTYDQSPRGQAAYIAATRAAFKKNYAYLADIIRAALTPEHSA